MPLYMRTEVDNFTRVGNPSVDADGIASNFSADNYLRKDNIGPFTQDDSFEINIALPEINYSADCFPLAIYTNDDTWMNIICDGQVSYFEISNLGVMITPEVEGRANNINLQYSKDTGFKFTVTLVDGQILEKTVTTTEDFNLGENLYLGYDPYSYGPFWGTIDLTKTYIKKNGISVWSWKALSPTANKIKDVYGGPTIFIEQDIEKVGTVIEYPSSPNSISVQTGVNYVKTTKSFDLKNAVSFEFVCYMGFMLPNNFFGLAGTEGRFSGFNLYYDSDKNKVSLELSTNGTSFDKRIEGVTSPAQYIGYFYKIEFTGSAYNYYIARDTNLDWILQGSISSSVGLNATNNKILLGIDDQAGSSNKNISINLNYCYLNINGKRVWSGMKKSPSRIKKCYLHNKLVYQALDPWEMPYMSSDNPGNGYIITSNVIYNAWRAFNKAWGQDNQQCNSNEGYSNRWINVKLPVKIILTNSLYVNGTADKHGVGLTTAFQIFTKNGGTPLTNYTYTPRSNWSQTQFTAINQQVVTDNLFIKIDGDGWARCGEIYLYGKLLL